jgi:hypothetical protein
MESWSQDGVKGVKESWEPVVTGVTEPEVRSQESGVRGVRGQGNQGVKGVSPLVYFHFCSISLCRAHDRIYSRRYRKP